mgnify:CR=1 FL=1
MQFLSDWKFWSVVISIVALILSQLPPIIVWFKRAKLDLELYSKISLTHKIGNPNVQMHLILSNIGGRKIKIKKITAFIKREGKLVAELPAVNFYQELGEKNTVLLTSFNLQPNDDWSHAVNFLNFYGREEEKKYRKFEGDIKNNIVEKRKDFETEPNKLIEADSDKVVPIINFFNEKYIWLAGEYEISVKIETDKTKADLYRNYRFTLFEYYEDELRKITEEYKYGAGVFWDSTTKSAVIVDLKEA